MSSDPHRPTIHFSPPANWMNDPCGLVWHNGLFHLYYQHNPEENRWGPMHWGHAVSEDLFHWRDRPVALHPDDTHGMAFTGSAVVVNAAAVQASEAHEPRTVPPLRAIYTGAVPQGSIHTTLQQQCLAVSADGDRWEPRGVVLPNPGVSDFRDPKVGRHPRSGRWYLVLAAGDHVQFFSSPDLEQWRYESSFGRGLGYTEGEWECPDLFQLPLPQDLSSGEPQDEPQGDARWVLVVHVGRGLSNRYAGAQYITGEFDGHQFHAAEADFRPVDQGHDFYAAQSWSGTAGRRIWIAWASHWAHSDVPQTSGWAGTLTLPRELSLVRDGAEGVALRQQPVRELAVLMADELLSETAPPHQRWETDGARAYRVSAVAPRQEPFQIILRFGAAGAVVVTRTAQNVRIDRSACDMGAFNSLADTDKTVSLITHSGTGTVDLIVDRSILEIFLDGGAVVTTDLLFPREELSAIECIGGDGVIGGEEGIGSEGGAGQPPVVCTVYAVQETIPR